MLIGGMGKLYLLLGVCRYRAQQIRQRALLHGDCSRSYQAWGTWCTGLWKDLFKTTFVLDVPTPIAQRQVNKKTVQTYKARSKWACPLADRKNYTYQLIMKRNPFPRSLRIQEYSLGLELSSIEVLLRIKGCSFYNACRNGVYEQMEWFLLQS